jgi:hypothetical protein
MNLSTTADAPLAVIKASSALAAAQSMILLFNAGSKREGAVMETCMVICSRDTSDEGTPVFLEMNVTSADVRLSLTYLREPENYPASNIREYTMADGTTYVWIVME